MYSQTDQRVLLTVLLPTMTLTQSLILLLLLGLKVTSEMPPSSCVLVMTRCVCNVMVIHNPHSLTSCFSFEELELRDGKLEVISTEISIILYALVFSPVDKLIFNNVIISTSFMNVAIPFFSYINLNKIEIISSTLEVAMPLELPELPNTSQIKSLLLENVTVDPALLQPSFQLLHSWLFGSLTSLVLVRSGLVQVDCTWARRFQQLTQLDLSENPISSSSLQNLSRCSSLSFVDLKSLGLRSSNLTSLQSLCTLLSLTPALTNLDVSGNNFSVVHSPHCPNTLRMLNLSHSGITQINSLLSASLEELDLSYNCLKVFNNPPQTLKKLNFSNNPCMHLPSLGNLSQLQELNVDSNHLGISINERASENEKLERPHAWRNPYQCDCALNKTTTFLNTTANVSEVHEEFLSTSPVDQQGTSGTQRRSSPFFLTLFTGLLSHMIYFY